MKPNILNCFRISQLLAVTAITIGACLNANATPYFWDINGATTGAGATATPTGTWSTGGTTLSTDSTGLTATVAQTTTTADTLTFAAGTNATGTYTVTVSGTQAIGGLTFQEGAVTLSGGTIDFGGVTGTITNGGTISSSLTGTNGFTKTTAGSLFLQGNNSGLSGSVSATAGLVFFGTSNSGSASAAFTSGSAGTGEFVLNGGTGTTVDFGSISGGGNLRIQAGSATSTASIGALNTNTTYSGNIYSSGATLALTKVGTGTLTLTGTNSYNGLTTISGGTLQIGSGVGGGTTGSLGTASVTNNASLVFNRSNALTVANAITGTGSVTKDGTGTTTFSTAKAYTGATTIKAGTLALTATGSLSSTSIVIGDTGSSGTELNVSGITPTTYTVGASQTVSGIGSLNAGTKDVTVSGNLAPGNSAGLLNVSTSGAGGLQLADNSVLNIEMTRSVAPAAGGNYDQLGLTGTLNIVSGADLTLSALGAGGWNAGDIYFLIANNSSDAITGEFQGFAEGSQITFDGQLFNVTYDANFEGTPSFSGGNDFALQVVPEPAAALLGSLGMLALLRRRRA
jgi:fibronectin-binding autotransporter adhesin